MKSITLSLYIKTFREHSKNHRESFQEILSNLFGMIHDIDAYPVESTTSSRIMNGEYDVPYQIRKEYNKKTDKEKMAVSDEFVSQMIDLSSTDMLIKEIRKIISESNISIQSKKELENEGDSHKILCSFLTIAIITDNRKILNKVLYKSNNASITLIGGDLIALGFNKKLAITNRIVVIPVDDKFTMAFKSQDGEDIISKDTIHGKWLSRVNKSYVQMPKIKYVKSNEKIRIGKVKIGKTEFYLLPVSSLKERYKAESSLDMINSAIKALTSEYNISGQGTPIYVPLIGTGRSRARLSLKESIDLIKDSFIRNENGFFGDVKIVVNQKIIEELEDL